MRITACLLLICVFLLVTLILLYNHLKTERDQMKNQVKEKSKALNSLNIKCNRLSDEKEKLEKNLTSVSLKKLELETKYSHLRDERDELQKNLTYMSLQLETKPKKEKCQKGVFLILTHTHTLLKMTC